MACMLKNWAACLSTARAWIRFVDCTAHILTRWDPPPIPLSSQYDRYRSEMFKIVFLGDSNVGKTCLAKLFAERKTLEQSTATIGFDYHTMDISLEDGTNATVGEITSTCSLSSSDREFVYIQSAIVKHTAAVCIPICVHVFHSAIATPMTHFVTPRHLHGWNVEEWPTTIADWGLLHLMILHTVVFHCM